MAEANTTSTKTIDQNLYDKKNFDHLEWFDDVFDILDDDDHNDEVENKIEEYNEDFDFNFIHTNVDEEEMVIEDDDDDDDQDNQIFEEEEEEQVLSQKLSQLSSKDDSDQEEQSSTNNKRSLNTPSTPDVASKKIRLLHDKNDQIPEYLQATNKSFDKIMTDHIMNRATTTTITMEDLRQLAILKHKIAVINIDKELWTVYLKSGTGQWKTLESGKTNVDPRIWPMQVKKIMSLKQSTTVADKGKDDQQICEDIVHECLQDFNTIIEQYQSKFNEKKNCLIGFTKEMEKAIETFIQQYGIQSFQMKGNYKIAILEYDYDAELLEREYLQLKPTQYQINIATSLYNLRYEHSQSKQELIELKQRVLCNKPTTLVNSTSWSMSTSIIDPMMNEKVHQRLLDQHEKERQQKITDLMAASIAEAETKIHECDILFNEKLLGVPVNDGDRNERLTGNLIDLIYRRFNIIDRKVEYIGNFRINYFLRSHYGELQEKINKTAIGFSPTMIIDTLLHQLTDEQIKFLNRGPTYVPPCQMYVSSSSSDVSINDMLQKQHKLLKHYLSIVFDKFYINPALSLFIGKEMKDAFTTAFSISLPLSMYQRAHYEKQLLQSIRQHLKANNLILRRTADNQNTFYLGNRKEFEDKANEYMTNTNAFEISETINETNHQQTRDYLNKMIKNMNSEMEKNIFKKKKAYKDLIDKLFIDTAKVELPYLYFLPDVSKKNVLSLKPVVVSQGSATYRLGQYLNGLLRPVLQRHAEATTFVNGADFIRKLNEYTNEQHRLRHPRTVFTTIKISNFYSMVSHADMLITLQDFLTDTLAIPGIGNVSITQIIDLTSLFLNNNRFYYDHKIYRFTKGAPSSLLLTETLCNIYVFQWQKFLLSRGFFGEGAIYGRCKNQIFFTWHKPLAELRHLLKLIDKHDTNVQLDIKIGLNVNFLNVHIENQNGTLYTRVDHDSTTIQKYTLPYVIGHSKVAHSHWLRSALIRAVRYCTSVADFNQERIYIELTCLANGYSLEFIERRIKHFFSYFDARSLRLFLDQHVYDKLRHRLFNFISEQHHFFNANQELEKNNQLVRLSYLYQFGAKHEFNKKCHKILSDILYTPPPTASTNNKIKIILTTKQQHSLNALLSRQKPSHQLLNKQITIF